ncbi:MAG: DEAD/DEAH box helicase family protein [Acidobacteria bacterium]|nr:DEAD/DEAH box helicase family protein [Acidobacteriota bacterium]
MTNIPENLESRETLLEENRRLLRELDRLKNENRQLKEKLELGNLEISQSSLPASNPEKSNHDAETTNDISDSIISNTTDSSEKIKLFMTLFKGRDDVYAKRWENRKKGTSGYSPVCLNEWIVGVCGKPKSPCSRCAHKSYAILDEAVIENHLRGNIVAGIYPLFPDESCCFLAIDFDEADWQKDIHTLRKICEEYAIPYTVERSRSGNGGHVWFFFENRISAALARKLGTALLTYSMNRRHEIRFKSYDRLFPSQDTLPKGGFGNLIALPLQKSARENNNSEFVDENFHSYPDQWAFLSTIRKLSEESVEHLISKLCPGHELGELKIDHEEDEEGAEKPWEIRRIALSKNDFPDRIEIVRANMLFIPKAGISQRGLNRIKRLASFKNPMFFRQQAMRLPTYGHPRVISCTDETENYICLPRECREDLSKELGEIGVHYRFTDKTWAGRSIDVEFKGELREEQSLALENLLRHETGILSGTTAFGKTVVALKLIAERKVNTLILVDRVSLLSQWKKKISEFLIINETQPDQVDGVVKKRGSKKKISQVGQLGSGRNTLNGIVDIAIMQSLSRKGEVKECIHDYGMIIADECHHASAFTYESILKSARAKYIYGLTATPTRKDGHHPIFFMHCGPIRYRDNPQKQAEQRPFDHFVVPRFTSLRIPYETEEKEAFIQDLYAEIIDSETRNQQIVDDVLANYELGRNCIVLSLRTAHVENLADKLREVVTDSDVITLTGGMGPKTTREVFQRISEIPEERKMILVATGHFIGEGFDEPRLDTLFLTMPISWKGTLQQYAGRLHRLYRTKKEVRIYDYVDVQVGMLERMYQRRLNGYAAMGYKAIGDDISSVPMDIIYNRESFLPVFINDIAAAKKEILIVSPFVRKRRTIQMMQQLKTAMSNSVRVAVVTRPLDEYKPADQGALRESLDLFKKNEMHVVLKPNIHQKFAIMDQKIVWYGSINYLSYGNAEESVMRIESAHIANELLKSISE